MVVRFLYCNMGYLYMGMRFPVLFCGLLLTLMYSKILILIFRVENHTINPYVQENLNPYILGRNPTLNPYVQENLSPYFGE